jgi:sec-independent protein translocase protein TatC
MADEPVTDEKRLPFLAHLLELRNRVMWCALTLLVAICACYAVAEELFDFLAYPLVKVLKEAPTLHQQSPADVFFVYVEIAVLAGIFASLPVFFYHFWRFVAPGLYKHERAAVGTFVLGATVCFIGGAAFAYYVAFPFGFEYLLGFAKGRKGNFSILEQLAKVYDLKVNYETARFVRAAIKDTIMMEKYIDMMVKLLLAFGLVFELPVVIGVLAKVGFVTARGLWRFFRYWIVIAFIIGAILTPPDVVSQVMMSVPLVLMYLVGIVIAWLVDRGRQRRELEQLGYTDKP